MDRPMPGKDSTRTSVQESVANAHSSGHSSGNDSSQALAAGVRAPDFSLHDTPDQIVSLSDFLGKRLILMFYPADWSPVCGDEVTLFNEVLPEFRQA